MTVRGWITQIVVLLAALIAAFPFYWLVVLATGTTSEIFTSPPRLIPGVHFFQNFGQVIANSSFLTAFANSALVAVTVTVLNLFLSSLAGFVFAKYRFPGRNRLFAILIAILILPTGVAIVPNFEIYAQLGWINTYLPLIVPTAVTALGVFWMRQTAVAAIPDELMQASSIDGAGFVRQYIHVGLPGMRAGMTALGIFQLMWTWNDYIWPLLVLADPNKYTIPVALQQLKGAYGNVDYSVVMAGALVATIPLVVIFLLFRRVVMANTAAGSVKG
jgi:cellobiose transport system permease protein